MALATLHDRLETDLQALIQGMNLQSVSGKTGNIGSNVVVQNLTEKLHVPKWPAVLVTAKALAEEEDGGSFEEDYVVYPVLVLVCDIARPQIQSLRPDYLSWRHDIMQRLRGLVNYPLLPNCPETQVIEVRAAPVLPDDVEAKQYVQSGLTALCHTSEARRRGGRGL